MTSWYRKSDRKRHVEDECSEAREIPKSERIPGDGGRQLCRECRTIQRTREKQKVGTPTPPVMATPPMAPTQTPAPQVTKPTTYSDDPRRIDRTPVERQRTVITDLTYNPCMRHGEHSTRPGYRRHQAAAGREPEGTCNPCWDFYEAVQAALKTAK